MRCQVLIKIVRKVWRQSMNKNHAYGIAAAIMLGAAAIIQATYPVCAEEVIQTAVYDGIKVGPVEIGGMTKEEAKAAVEAYIEGLLAKKITLSLEGSDKKIEALIGDTGLTWANPQVIDEIDRLGRSGNVICRYKTKKDITNSGGSFSLEFSVDEAKIKAWIESNHAILESPAVDAVMQKTEEGFSITPEQVGSTVDIEASVLAVKEYLTKEWNYEDCTIALVGTVTNPTITKAECEKIGAVPMGAYTTSYTSSSSSRCKNIDVAVEKINGAILMPGQKFSCLEYMVPFSAENGYFPAGSYFNGMLVDSYGGGVCQVSTTLYNAVLLSELEVNQRYNHGLTVAYVPLSSDAAVAESSGMDFIFTNNTNAPIYIEGYTKDKHVTFNIYGMDERPANRKIEYKSVVIQVINPPEDVIKEDPSLPEGARKVTQGSHTGYRAELYKYVYVDGQQVSKEQVNSSYYAPAPNYVSVGPGTLISEEPTPEGDPNVPAVNVVPSEPQPNQPGDQPSNPTDNGNQPGAQPNNPTDSGNQPGVQPNNPTDSGNQPGVQPSSPIDNGNQPGNPTDSGNQPGVQPGNPTDSGNQPSNPRDYTNYPGVQQYPWDNGNQPSYPFDSVQPVG